MTAEQQLIEDLAFVWEERKKNHQMERDLVRGMKDTGVTWVGLAEVNFDVACRAFAHATKCFASESEEMLDKALNALEPTQEEDTEQCQCVTTM